MGLVMRGIGSAIAYFVGDMLIRMCVSFVGRVLVALGIGTVTVTGFNAIINSLMSTIQGTMPADGQVYALASSMGVIWFISTIMSGVTTRMVIAGLTSDSATFWVKRQNLPKT